MLEQLLNDTTNLAAAAPDFIAAAQALQATFAALPTIDPAAVAAAATDLAGKASTLQADVESVLDDLQALPADAPAVASVRTLRLLDRLKLSPADLAELKQLHNLTTTTAGAGKVNWCGLAAAAQAIVAQLTAAGLPIPPYIAMVFSVLSALCPKPS